MAALHEASKERTREDTPFLWAETEENLALAHFALFNKGNGPTHRNDALNAIDGALEEYRKAKAAFYIDRAAGLREKILAGQRSQSYCSARIVMDAGGVRSVFDDLRTSREGPYRRSRCS